MIERIDELIEWQRKKLLGTALRIVPQIVEDDLLQPNDFPELELHPHFRYEEGLLHGLQAARTALLADFAPVTDENRSGSPSTDLER